MKGKQTFKVLLEKDQNTDAMAVAIPFDVEKVFGGRRVPVKVSVNGAEYRSTVFRMNGQFRLVVPRHLREAAGVSAGEMITVSLEKDTEKREVSIPEDLAAALAKANLTEAFAKMSYTHQKEYVNAIGEAKKEETRTRRIAKTVEQIAARG